MGPNGPMHPGQYPPGYGGPMGARPPMPGHPGQMMPMGPDGARMPGPDGKPMPMPPGGPMGPDGKRMPMGPGGPRMMLPPNHPIMMEMQALDHYLRGLFQQPQNPQIQAKVKLSIEDFHLFV